MSGKIQFGPIVFCAALGLGLLSACSDGPTAERILRDNGYSSIVTNGHSFFGCGKEDTFATKFTATSPAGKRISGAVCSGWLKGGTIRFD